MRSVVAGRAGTGAMLVLPLLIVAGCGVRADHTENDQSDSWSQWRGPGARGVSGAPVVPTSWPGGDGRVRWRAAVPGAGTSSPVVASGLVFLTTAWPVVAGDPAALQQRAAVAWDLATGREVWRAEIVATPAEEHHDLNSMAGPTPVVDGERLYAYFGSHLAALDASAGGRGRVLWLEEVSPNYARFSHYGAASSPVLTAKDVIIVEDKEGGSNDDIGFIAAFDRGTGRLRWRTEWQETCCSYSTPLVLERGTGIEIVLAHSGRISGYHATSGVLLWSFEYPMLQMVSTPLYERTAGGEERLYVLGGADNRRGNLGLRLRGTGSATKIDQLWHSERMVPQAASPVLWRGRIYSVTLQGVVVAWDPATGESLWHARTNRARNHSSLVVANDRLFVTSSSGAVSVLDLSEGDRMVLPVQRLIAANTVGEQGNSASPAIAGGCFLQRTESALWCIEHVAG